ncbi:MAG: phosphoribosylaminoimidazolesuccinocarboxamide synthase [Planctomycetota bacterium]
MAEAVLDVDLPGLRRCSRGKVRDIFEAGDHLLLVCTDRFSAFDVVLNQGIPGRGVVLTRLSAFWFALLERICPHHLVTTDLARMPAEAARHADRLRGRTMLVRRLDIVPVECVVRGFLAGSGWKEYRERGSICGVVVPAGLRQSDRLPQPIFTPTTKAHAGHDLPLTFAEVEERTGPRLARRLRERSIELYRAAARHAEERGILLADTKFEFGVADGELCLADEALTPDSSRYWDRDAWEPGRPQESYDKQIVRDWLERSGWDKEPPPPDLSPEIVERVRSRYLEIAGRLTS